MIKSTFPPTGSPSESSPTLVMEVAQSRKGIFFVSQRKYVLDLLKETRILKCNPIDTLMDSTTKLGAKKDKYQN